MVYDRLFDKEPIHRKGIIVLNSELEAGKNAYGSNAKADVLIKERLGECVVGDVPIVEPYSGIRLGHRVSQALHLVDEMGTISLAAHVRLVVEKLSLRLGSKVRLNNWWTVIVLLAIGGDEVRNSINVLSRGHCCDPDERNKKQKKNIRSKSSDRSRDMHLRENG
jgi:hypothetical protein